MADQAVLEGKPSVKPKFTRGAPLPERGTLRLHVERTTPNFSNGEETPPAKPRFVRGDRLPKPPPSGLVKAEDIREPFIRPIPRAKLMAGR